MKAFTPPRSGSICHFCRQTSTRPTATWTSLAARVSQQERSVSTTQPGKRCKTTAPVKSSSQPTRRWLATKPSPATVQVPQEELTRLDARVNELVDKLTQPTGVPKEEEVLQALEEYQSMARRLLQAEETAPKATTQDSQDTAVSALLFNLNKPQSASVTRLLDSIASCADCIFTFPSVFVTPSILESYVKLQALLKRPNKFPEMFRLFREKPIPRPTKSGQWTLEKSKPSSASAAIPPPVADIALGAAIASRNLSLALDTIDETYCTTSFKRSKFLRTALLPLTAALLTPPAAYTLATRFSDWQTSMDPSMATNVAMAGILTYSMAVGTVGYVALTTANDQMVRVTWAMGVPLWERWIREEERGAIDKISQAWGFTNTERWGEEEGEDWEYLKEYCGLRGMMLDRVELMDGME